jgi:nucleoid-associated protein EbfC
MNPFDIMKNAQELQDQFGRIQEEMRDLSETGSAGGNMVQVTINGQMEMTGIKLDPACVDNRDIPMLQDLIVAAHHDAIERIQQDIKDKYGPLLGGLNIPGLTPAGNT